MVHDTCNNARYYILHSIPSSSSSQAATVAWDGRVGALVCKVSHLVASLLVSNAGKSTHVAQDRRQVLDPTTSLTSTTTATTPVVVPPSMAGQEPSCTPSSQGASFCPSRCRHNHRIGVVLVFSPATITSRELRRWASLCGVSLGWVDIFLRLREVRTRVGKLAIRTVGAKSCQVCLAQCPPNMSSRALGAQPAEPPVVVWTFDPLIPRVVVETLSAELALANLDKPRTHRHRSQVPVVRVLAVVAYFAQVTQVVLAHCCFLFPFTGVGGQGRDGLEVGVGRRRVSQRAGCWSQRTAERLQVHPADLVICCVSTIPCVHNSLLTRIQLEVALPLQVPLNVEVDLVEVRANKVGRTTKIRCRRHGERSSGDSEEESCKTRMLLSTGLIWTKNDAGWMGEFGSVSRGRRMTHLRQSRSARRATW